MAFFTGSQCGAQQKLDRFLVFAAKKIKFHHQKLFALGAIAGLALLLNGCAAVAPISSAVSSVSPSTTLQIFNTTELRLQQKNFLVVKPNIRGEARGFALLGIITIVPARFSKAMDRLNSQADMKPGTSRTLANLVLEKDSSYYILFSIPKTSVRADVIEFIPDAQPQPSTGSTNTINTSTNALQHP